MGISRTGRNDEKRGCKLAFYGSHAKLLVRMTRGNCPMRHKIITGIGRTELEGSGTGASTPRLLVGRSSSPASMESCIHPTRMAAYSSTRCIVLFKCFYKFRDSQHLQLQLDFTNLRGGAFLDHYFVSTCLSASCISRHRHLQLQKACVRLSGAHHQTKRHSTVSAARPGALINSR